jgi:hypothetical protein
VRRWSGERDIKVLAWTTFGALVVQKHLVNYLKNRAFPRHAPRRREKMQILLKCVCMREKEIGREREREKKDADITVVADITDICHDTTLTDKALT